MSMISWAGKVTIVEAARRGKLSEQSIGRWKADFLEANKTGPSRIETWLSTALAVKIG